jgi:hypothetical protein
LETQHISLLDLISLVPSVPLQSFPTLLKAKTEQEEELQHAIAARLVDGGQTGGPDTTDVRHSQCDAPTKCTVGDVWPFATYLRSCTARSADALLEENVAHVQLPSFVAPELLQLFRRGRKLRNRM